MFRPLRHAGGHFRSDWLPVSNPKPWPVIFYVPADFHALCEIRSSCYGHNADKNAKMAHLICYVGICLQPLPEGTDQRFPLKGWGAI